MQDALRKLSDYWTERGCLVVQPFNTEVGAGTMNPATVLRVLGPEPWRVAYVEPSVRPDDSRYGENPNRLQTHTQFQVILKPDPGNPQELYLGSLEALGIDLHAHDVRFVEDNWQQPAIGAWGLGWEVWLDGMEITQFTYFQQVGGLTLDPVAVELTYGMERILMAVQGATHFKDIVYGTGPSGEVITYGEAFGQSEYEMSRYYLDDADVEANERLYETYVAEAARLVAARLPVPAHTYVLKSSHAFNVLDARGAISTTERAKAFSTMRRLAKDVSTLWVERREELGFPLLAGVPPRPAVAAPQADTDLSTEPQTLAVEIGVEELPPHVVPETIDAVRAALTAKLGATLLTHGGIVVEGTPRRIVATVADVAAYEPDTEKLAKGPKWAAAYDADGNPTKALEGFLRGQKAGLDRVVKAEIGGNEHAAVASTQPGRGVMEVLTQILGEIVAGLHADKNMRWADPALSFSRPIRWLLALWGSHVVPVVASELVAGRTTYVHRLAEHPHVEVAAADDLLPLLEKSGIVVDVTTRMAQVVEYAERLATEVGGVVDAVGESAIVEEITHLVEQPVPVRGSFDERYLDLPEQILTTVMRKHQRYLPVRDGDGRLMPYFVTMANGACDAAVVAAGNESVLRARFEDALFFWNADLKAASVEEFVPGLEQLTFENRLGSVGARARRIDAVARALADGVGLHAEPRAALERAGRLAKFDLATQLVVEMSSLAGFVAREYAARKGEPEAVATALYEMEQPRTAADAIPATLPGALLALGDRFDLLMGMFALGAKPSGSSDPYGLRRAAIGVVRILRERSDLADVSVRQGLDAAAETLRDQGIDVTAESVAAAEEFTTGRFAQLLRDEGVHVDLIAAVSPSLGTPGQVSRLLDDIAALRDDTAFRDLVAAVVRIDRILPADVAAEAADVAAEAADASYDAALLTEPAEVALKETAEALRGPGAGAGAPGDPGDVRSFADRGQVLVAPVRRFFDDILVMAEDPALRAARLGLLATIRALAPAAVDWRALDTALG